MPLCCSAAMHCTYVQYTGTPRQSATLLPYHIRRALTRRLLSTHELWRRGGAHRAKGGHARLPWLRKCAIAIRTSPSVCTYLVLAQYVDGPCRLFAQLV